MLKGIHSSAKSRWIEQVDNVLPELMNEPLACNVRAKLEHIAQTTHGIGPISVDETLVDILEEQSRLKRGF